MAGRGKDGDSGLDIVPGLVPVEGEPTEEEEPGKPRPVSRILSWVLLLLTICIALLAWPPWLGGVFGATVIGGISMEPTYHTDDVVLTMKSFGGYDVGQVIVYAAEFGDQKGRLIHRIVAKNPNGTYTTQGDNKEFPDPWEVQPSEISGRVITLLPQGMRVLGLLRSPLFWVLPFGFLVARVFWPQKGPEDEEDEGDEDRVGGAGGGSGVSIEGPFHPRWPGVPGARAPGPNPSDEDASTSGTSIRIPTRADVPSS